MGLVGKNQRGCQQTVAWFCSCWRALFLSCQSFRHAVGCRTLTLLTVVTFGIRSIFVCTQELEEQLPAGIYFRGDFLSVQDASEFNSAIQDTIYFLILKAMCIAHEKSCRYRENRRIHVRGLEIIWIVKSYVKQEIVFLRCFAKTFCTWQGI